MSASFLSELRELISYSIPVENYIDSKGRTYSRVTLEERSSDGEVQSSICIGELPQDVFVFKCDSFPQPQALFNDIKNVRCRADFILLASDGKGKKRIVFIELKRKKGEKNHIEAQLRGAICIFDYCNSILKNFWKESSMIQGYEPRFVSFKHNGASSGKKFSKKDAPLHESPDKMLELSGRSFTYHQLIRK